MILDYVSKSKTICKISSKDSFRVSCNNKNFNIYQIASDYLKNNRMIFVVLPTLFDAQNYYDALINLVCEDDVLFFPVDDLILASSFISSNEFKYERINTILSILKKEPKIVVTTINGATYKNVSETVWQEKLIHFEEGMEYQLKDIKMKLVELGYKNTSLVNKTGEFSFRGSIIDIFPLNNTNPIRLDFFDDELDSIKLFDVSTQRTIAKIKDITIGPIVEMFYSDAKKEEVISLLKEKAFKTTKEERDLIYKDIHRIDLRDNLETLHQYIDLFNESKSIFDFVSNKKIYVINEDKINAIIANNYKETISHLEAIGALETKEYVSFNFDFDFLKKYNVIYIDTLVNHLDTDSIDVEEIEDMYGNYNLLLKAIKNHLGTNKVVLAISSLDRLRRLKEFFLENRVIYQTIKEGVPLDDEYVNIIEKEYALPLSIPSDGIYILNEDVIYSNIFERPKIRYKSTFFEGSKISKHDELAPGDYVVHINHGIGLYECIKTMELSGKKRDYIKINYAKGESLYIPIEQLSMIKKYSSVEGKVPELTKLGSASWVKTKQKVKEKVEELSKKLIELYAQRNSSLGYKYGPDTTEQIEFEEEFSFEATKDQMIAINAIKADMESDKVMDRLVCGDVGFGKTEVALRAAFKAVMDGKQVCYLAPTTILARQHYHTFLNRMEKYGVRVELLNRFVSGKKAKEVLKDLAFGTVDVIIGTHRLLSNDVIFKDLGLLITDEEHRFGVMHKEKIKEMKVNVDSLMLTATPIPRTLQMSLLGIKDLSMIETPPKNRYPIQTYVTPRHDSIVKDAIERELLRGGQVFYLYNYTEDIAEVMTHIAKLVPEAKICFAHGKMNKNELEDIISSFIDHKYDVMVSTTIIETGIDIPEANTLIIHDADRLGLSQLYQIRGRIGRSDKIAYAYLMYEPRKILTPEAEKRLETIKEFTELGSGFKIAMRDLSIRGAGDLLGHEQSGFINSVGIDLYMQILDETLKKMTGNAETTKTKSSMGVNVLSNRYIPNEYEINEDLKIEIHNKISSIESFEDFDNLKAELTDRFGKVNEELLGYMYEKLFYSLCRKADIEKLDIKPKMITLNLTEERSQIVSGEHVYKTAYSLSNNFILSYHDRKIFIGYKTESTNNNSWLPIICQYLSLIA